jgi:hypothetical protein
MKFSAKFAVAAAFAALVAVAAPASFAKPKPPVIDAPPMPPPMPSVGFGLRFLDQAAAYQTYVIDAAAISPAFSNAAGVANTLRTGSAYEPEQLRRGAIVNAAIAALGDAEFVDAVRRTGVTPEARYAIVARTFADPRSVLAYPGATRALALAKAALAQTGMRVFNDGDSVRLAAYAIQHQPWSLDAVADRDQRLIAVKSLSSTQRRPNADDRMALERQIQGVAPATVGVQEAPPPYSALLVRAVALAALAAVGQASDDDFGHLGWLTDDYYLDHCLAETKLSLYECLAVAKPNYEDVFCLGQHALKDTGACLVKSAYSTIPIDVITHPMAVPAAHYHAATHAAARHKR